MIWETLTFTQRLILLKKLVSRGEGSIPITYTGNLPATITAVAHAIASLTRYGLCTQDGTPTPDAPVDIMCNNGALYYGIGGESLINSTLDGQGTFVTPGGSTNRVYKAFPELITGQTYTVSIGGDSQFEMIIQYRIDASNFGNISGWTREPVTFKADANRSYGLAIRKGDANITPADFTGTLSLQKHGIYCGGTHAGKNLYNPASAWMTHMPIGFEGGGATWPNSAPDTYPNSITYFMRVKPNTTYTYSCSTAGDRFGVCGVNRVIDPSDYTTASRLTFDSILVSLKSSGVGKTYTFTTGANTQMIAVYCALNTVPTDIQIEEGSTATAYEPYEEIPYEPEVLTVRGKNLYNADASATGKTLNDSGELVALTDSYRCRYTDLIPVKPNTEYAFKLTRTDSGIYTRICSYDALGQFIALKYKSLNVSATTLTTTFTTEANAAYVRMSFKLDSTDIQLEEGNTQTAYEPYVQPQTVTDIPMLLGVGDYKDAVELINGIKTGRVGVKVFDGTETFTVSPSGSMITTIPDVAIGAPNVPMNTRFDLETSATSVAVGAQRFGANGTEIYSTNYYMKHPTITTAPEFKSWLAAQHAAGKPVFALYPCATETTEQTTAQHLVTHEGVNIVDSVANVSPVEAEIEYYGTEEEPAPMLGMMIAPRPNGGAPDDQDEPEGEGPEDEHPIEDAKSDEAEEGTVEESEDAEEDGKGEGDER